MKKLSKSVSGRIRRKKRIKLKIRGTSAKPRLCVFRSAKHIYAQIVDDSLRVTLASSSSVDKEIAKKFGKGGGGNIGAAKIVGKSIAEKAGAKGIKTVVFDRGGYLYHGRVKALADAARERGLEF
ncbi:MAG: 50S ribosomal protein L18 [Deltaproteobacteria bacterium]|uniref:Large ribosomal subunit protein uL18 n=1 Tax=Candidatus Zymogenus saltonus TaxID=2844893 RepID=A0A9D8PNM0_9DELT|nr:50S ribosomal protein L18 [Candidatus Zymogenus saltonus]